MKSTESTESAPETEPSGAATDDAGWVGRAKAKVQQKRTVCDHCRRRSMIYVTRHLPEQLRCFL